MAFHFALETILHFRKSVEHQQELLLRLANQQVMRVRHLIDQVDECIARGHVERARELGTGTTSAELQFHLSGEAVLAQHRQELQIELRRLQQLREQQQKAFQNARREREVLDSLRQKQLQRYQRDLARKEQRQLDDLHLFRRSYLQRG
jgi:flagellar protein FliJ